jgi:hypothetical protein
METYTHIMAAVQLIDDAMVQVSAEDGPTVISPAWAFLKRAEQYLLAQADDAMRGIVA